MLLTVKQFAERCGPAITEGIVRDRIRRGDLPVTQLGGRGRYLIDSSLVPEGATEQRETVAERRARNAENIAAIAAM